MRPSCSREKTLASWEEGEVIDVQAEMMRLAISIVARTLIGVDLEHDIEVFEKNNDILLNHIDSVSNIVLPSWAPTPGNRQYQRAIQELQAVVSRIVTDRRSDPSGEDVLSRLIRASEERDLELRDEHLRDQVMTFLLAGHETTALALTFAFYLLGQYPNVERALIDEFDETLGGDPPTRASVDALSYTDRVITEVLRLYPPVDHVVRSPIEDDTIAGYTIPAGSNVWLSQWVVHHAIRDGTIIRVRSIPIVGHDRFDPAFRVWPTSPSLPGRDGVSGTASPGSRQRSSSRRSSSSTASRSQPTPRSS